MFTITSTRIVGLIAVACTAIVAPQALATPKIVAPPDVEARQEQSNASTLAAAGPRKSVTAGSTAAAIKALQRRSADLDAAYRHLYPGAYTQAARNSDKSGSTAAAIKALQRRSADLDAAYRKLYPGAYTQAAQKSDKAAVWSFPSCSPIVAAEYDSYIYSGDPCRI